MVTHPLSRFLRLASRIAAVTAVGAALAMTIIDLSQPDGWAWARRHSWTSQMLSALVVLIVGYVIIDQALRARERARWREGSWDPFEDFANAVYYFLAVAEDD